MLYKNYKMESFLLLCNFKIERTREEGIYVFT